ncbi:MAG: PKD domain-containing protein, partial [Bacteroidota bacterium]
MVIRFIVCLFFYWGSILIGHAQSLGLLDTSSLSIRTQADSVCKGQQAQLSVVSGVKAAFQWYREGKLLHTGSDYETPPLESTTTYEVYVFLSPESTPYTLAVEAFVFDSSAVKFDWSPRKIETPDAEVNFRLAPLPMAKSVIWDFGDGGVDSSFDANHTYQYPGTYKVAATIQWRTSCTQTVSQMLKVSQKPRMVFPSAFSPNGDGY